MPLYEFACQTCGSEVELLIRGDETPVCPSCQGTKLEKLLSVPARGPRESAAPAPSGCDPSKPPCSPSCCRLPRPL